MKPYAGWKIVAAATLVTLLSVGMRMGIGPFFLPMSDDLGYSRSLLGGIVSVGMFCYGLGMPLAGYLVARRGTRFVLLLGAVLIGLAAVWTVNARDPINFLLSYGILMSFGLAMTSPVAFTPVISRWFIRRRGMALFFLSTGSMAGMAIMTPALTFSVAAAGWQAALLGAAAFFALITVPAALFVIRDEAPAQADLPVRLAGQGSYVAQASAGSMSLREAVRTAPFWMICLGMFACGYSMNLIGAHGVPMLMDHGFDATTSSLGIGLIGFVAIFGTVFLGQTADKLPRRYILATIYFVRGLGFLGLMLVGTHGELFGVSAIGGLVWAGSIAVSSAILADVYGVKLVGVLYGLAYLGHQIGGTISTWLGGWAFEAFGTHWISFGSAGALLLLAAALSLRLPPEGFTLLAPTASASDGPAGSAAAAAAAAR